MNFKSGIWLLAAAVALGGCASESPVGDILEGRRIDYQSDESQVSRALQFPPDLIGSAPEVEDEVLLSEYKIADVPALEAPEVAEQPVAGAVVRYRRDGKLRWVETDLEPGELWPRARNFWTKHMSFALESEDPQLGTMETIWLDLRKSLGTPGLLGGYLDDLLDRIQDSGERDKFTTRIERGEDGGADIYVAHRHVAARFSEREGIFSGYESLPSDPQLEVEMLRRLMLYLARRDLPEDDAQAQATTTDIDEAIAAEEAQNESDEYELVDGALLVSRSFQRAWQLVQIGLERGGFTLIDRDLQEGILIIQHSGGPETDEIFGKLETGFFNKLFAEEKPILRDIEIVFTSDSDEVTRVIMRAPEGESDLSELQVQVLMELLIQHLP